MNLKRVTIPAVLAAAALVAGCGGGDGDSDDRAGRGENPPAAATQESAVTVKTFMFGPDPIEIDAGETVTWTNEDSAVHTVTSGTRERPDGRFDERLDESGGTTQQTFDKPGTYEYFCSLHSGPGMEAVVVVR